MLKMGGELGYHRWKGAGPSGKYVGDGYKNSRYSQ